MTIDEAIKRLQGYIRWRKPDPRDNFHEAIQLGIEALKRIVDGRIRNYDYFSQKLPGETEEGK